MRRLIFSKTKTHPQKLRRKHFSNSAEASEKTRRKHFCNSAEASEKNSQKTCFQIRRRFWHFFICQICKLRTSHFSNYTVTAPVKIVFLAEKNFAWISVKNVTLFFIEVLRREVWGSMKRWKKREVFACGCCNRLKKLILCNNSSKIKIVYNRFPDSIQAFFINAKKH